MNEDATVVHLFDRFDEVAARALALEEENVRLHIRLARRRPWWHARWFGWVVSFALAGLCWAVPVWGAVVLVQQ